MSNASLGERERNRDAGVIPRKQVALVRGLGCEVWDADGKSYVDLGGVSYGAMNVGHCHPKVVAALRAQADQLWFAGQTWPNDQRAALLEKLVSMAPRGTSKAFLCNSGTEAIEGALKFARGSTGRSNLVAFRNAFHGRSMGALSLTWKPQYRKPFEPLVPGVTFVPYGDTEALKQAVDRATAAVFVEPVQGEGGVHVAPPGFLRAVRDITSDAGALMVADEIQTGLGRTGRMWGVDHAGVQPDVACVAKSVAGGFPMGAVLLSESAAKVPQLSHGTTFGGAPLACAAASAALDVIVEERLAERAARLGPRLMEGLRGIGSPHVREVRGLGLMVALDLRMRNGPLLQGMMERGALGLATGSTAMRYLPPLVITEAQMDQALAATRDALAAMPAQTAEPEAGA